MLMRQAQSTDFKLLCAGDAALADPHLLVASPIESCGFAAPELQRALAQKLACGMFAQVSCDGQAVLTTALRKRSFPAPFYESWETPLSPSGVPAISSDAPEAAVAGLLDGLKAPVVFKQLPVDGEAFALLKHVAGHFHVVDEWQRAGLITDGTFDDWLKTNFDQKRRKELNRLRARLSEQGALETQRLTNLSDLQSFVDDFLRLEAASWKGNRGTALEQSRDLTKALRQALSDLMRAGKLRFWRVMFDGKAVATLFAFVEAGRATLGKIAHDEAFAKFSPGVMVIIDATADFFADPGIRVADANAIPGHPMIDRIWRNRLPMANVMVASHGVSVVHFNLIRIAEERRLALRKLVKNMYYKVKGDKAS